MKVTRNKAILFSRRAPRSSGCAPLLVVLLVAMAVVVVGRNWFELRLNLNRAPGRAAGLPETQAAFDRGDLSAAIDYARQVLESDGAAAAAYELLVRALIYRSYSELDRESDRHLALELSQEALTLIPRNLDIQALNAYALQAAGYADEANRIALRLVERAPEHVLARIALSQTYGALGLAEASLREAEAALSLASEQNRLQLESQRALALAYAQTGRHSRALEALEQAMRFNNKLVPLHFEMALFASQAGNVDRATVSYFQIIALDEDNVKVRVRLCELSDRLQERAAARRYCEEATELAPIRAEGWYQLGRLYYLDGEYEQAQSAFGQCRRLQVEAGVAIKDRQLECWYLQGQSAEIRGDCAGLMGVYREFQAMASAAQLPQTWTYPPEGPPICAQATRAAQEAASP